MKTKYLVIVVMLVCMVSGCQKNVSSNVPDIMDAYEAVEKSNDMIEVSTEDNIGAGREDTVITKEQELSTQAGKQDGPARKTSSESTIVGMYDEVEYSGIKFQVEQVVKSASLNALYNIMDKEGADAFRVQLTQGFSKDWFEDGHIRDTKWSEMFIVKCTMSNTTSDERVISMQLPLYSFKGEGNMEELTSGENIDMSQFGPEGAVLDFYGEHTKFVNPQTGIETDDSYQYITLKPGETKEIYVAYEAYTLYNPPETKYFISTYFLGGNQNISLDLPKGTQLIPLEEYD